MKQAIAGVGPADVQEVTIMTVWPSVARYGLGQLLGRLYENSTGVFVFTLGNLFALLFIPVSLVLYFVRVAPWIGVRYELTNRRVIVQRGITGKVEERSLPLERFDTIEIQVHPGQAWYDAGDLVFLRSEGAVEAFRLEGVSRPQSFRHICLKARMARVGVQRSVQVASS